MPCPSARPIPTHRESERAKRVNHADLRLYLRLLRPRVRGLRVDHGSSLAPSAPSASSPSCAGRSARAPRSCSRGRGSTRPIIAAIRTRRPPRRTSRPSEPAEAGGRVGIVAATRPARPRASRPSPPRPALEERAMIQGRCPTCSKSYADRRARRPAVVSVLLRALPADRPGPLDRRQVRHPGRPMPTPATESPREEAERIGLTTGDQLGR